MNPQNGEIYAMGSLPTFNPNIFTKPVPQSTYNRCSTTHSAATRCSTGRSRAPDPTGSTFKPITATAALESGAWSVGSIFDDTGGTASDGQCRHNAGNAVDGSLDLDTAIKVSSDDFFYNLGVLTNAPAPNGGALQQWAREYGIGQQDRNRPGRRDRGNPADAGVARDRARGRAATTARVHQRRPARSRS